MPIIEVANLVKTYDDVNVVDGVSFSVEEGEIFGIVGPNGAGKTTTVECVEGLRRPDGGSIQVLGLDPNPGPVRDHRACRVHNCRRAGCKTRSRSERPSISMPPSTATLPIGANSSTALVSTKVDAKYAKLSGGQKQRLAIALGACRVSRDRDPRRADHRPRPAGSTVDVGHDREDQGGRRHGRLGHTLHGGSRAIVRPNHGDRSRPSCCDRLTFRSHSRNRLGATLDVPTIGADRRRRVRKSVGSHVRRPRDGPHVVITGTGNVVLAVTALLADRQIVAEELRVEQTSLEDAYLELTSGTGNSDEAEPEAN